MATILLVGGDAALLEGLSQALASAGHRPRVAAGVAEARTLANAEQPLVVVASRALAAIEPSVAALRVAPGGALLLFHASAEHAPSLPSAVQRAALADLALPLERHRLLALVQRIDERSRVTGRSHRTPPERRALG